MRESFLSSSGSKKKNEQRMLMKKKTKNEKKKKKSLTLPVNWSATELLLTEFQNLDPAAVRPGR